jgi:hypothetical protein
MINGYPLFPGTNEQDQLLRIFQILGTPTLQTWLEILNVPHFDVILIIVYFLFSYVRILPGYVENVSHV